MNQNTPQFSGAVPELYERLLVPLLFAPHSALMAERVGRLAPQAVLEVAAGTGSLTEAMLSVLPDGATILATDVNPAMLERNRLHLIGRANVGWQVVDAHDLPFADQRFDVVVCQFGAMFFTDRVKAFREARRVLRPDHVYLASVWDALEMNEVASVVNEAVAQLCSDDPPDFFARVPHGYHDHDRIRNDLAEAGFGKITVETVGAESRAADALQAARAMCQGTPLRGELEQRGVELNEATAHVTAALERAFGSGAVTGRTSAVIVTAQ